MSIENCPTYTLCRVVYTVQPFFKYYSNKAEADKKKHDEEGSAENYLHLYWTVFKKVCSFVLSCCGSA